MADPATKKELLAEIEQGYRGFESLLVSLDETQVTTPGVSVDWSMKDMLAHLAAWQGRAADSLEAILARNEEYQPVPSIQTAEDVHQFNAETFLTNQLRPLDDIWSDFRSTYQRILAGVRALDEEDIFNKQRFAWTNGDPFWESIANCTFRHYRKHAPAVEEWLASRRA